MIVWPAVLVVLLIAAWQVRNTLLATADVAQSHERVVRSLGLIEPTHKHLDPSFTDKDGRLLADPPSSANQFLDPATLVVAHPPGSDKEVPSIPWSQFDAFLAKETGKVVKDIIFESSPQQIDEIRKGLISLVVAHSADAPFLVNQLGYQPAAVWGDESGTANGNHIDFIVPAASSISKLADFKGHSMVCTVPSSITGYRAPVALLIEEEALRPNVDYVLIWSLSQSKSITGIKDKKYEIAAVSDDKLQSMVKKKKITSDEYKTIHQSGVIPRTTIGWFYNLKPELATSVRDAILKFRPTAGSTGDPDDADDASSKPMRFNAIDYKKDFEFVRQIDDRFDPRLDMKIKARKSTSTQPATTQPS